jgi:hypothetical protein
MSQNMNIVKLKTTTQKRIAYPLSQNGKSHVICLGKDGDGNE